MFSVACRRLVMQQAVWQELCVLHYGAPRTLKPKCPNWFKLYQCAPICSLPKYFCAWAHAALCNHAAFDCARHLSRGCPEYAHATLSCARCAGSTMKAS